MKTKQLKIEIDLKHIRKAQRIALLIKNKTGSGKHKNKKKDSKSNPEMNLE
jgi:hypothetical protein